MKAKGDSGEYQFTRAAYDEIRDSELAHGVHYDVRLETGYQKGIWCLRVTAQGLLDDDKGRQIARWEGTWPNSTATSFAAYLYAAAHRVARMVEDYRNDEHKRTADRHTVR